MELLSYPVLKLGIRHITCYDYTEWPRKKKTPGAESASLANLKRGKIQHFGEFSQRNIKRTVNTWMLTQELASQLSMTGAHAPGKHTFATLTLPSSQMHCDKVIKREGLNFFLIEARRRWKMRNFLWKAEAQDNGNIHFHLLSDKYLDKDELREIWNRQINRLGYVDHFESRHGHRDPNSTDIHALRKVSNVSAYVCKYVAKAETGRMLCGNYWYASDNVKKLKPIQEIIDYELHRWLEDLKAKELHQVKTSERCAVTLFERPIDYRTLPSGTRKRVREALRFNLEALRTV